MADTNQFVQAPVLYLSGSGVSSTATSIGLTSFRLPDGTTEITMSDFGTAGYITLEPGTEREENITFTGITQSGSGPATLTGVTRGLGFVAPYTTVAALRQAHAGGTAAVVSNSAPFYNELSGKDNDETITGTWTFTSTAIPLYNAAPTFTTDQQIITKKYADDLAIAGAPDSNATTKGLLELASIAEASASAAAGSGDTTAALAITTALTSNTSGAAQIIPVTDADGDIPVEFMELNAAWTFTSTLDIATATNFQLGGVAYTGTMADLNEASTIVQATDVSGAELETLTDTSNADALHIHDPYQMAVEEIDAKNFVTWQSTLTDTGTWSEAITGGQIVQNPIATLIETGATSGNDAILLTSVNLTLSGNTNPKQVDWDNDLSLAWSSEIVTTTNQDLFLGFAGAALAAVPADATYTTKHAGFFVQDGTLKASIADGATQETATIAGVTLTDINSYRIEHTAASDVKFYVNDTLEATLSTNVPAGVTVRINFGATTVENVAKGFTVYSNMVLKAELIN